MKLQKLLSLTRQAIDAYGMIKENDKIAVGISGGKDSLTPVSYTHLDVYKRQLCRLFPVHKFVQER